jgi:hypothetical protein
MSERRTLSIERSELALLLLILLAAVALRLWRLHSVPPGFTHDEAGHGHDAAAILHGARPIYQTVGYGREPLYDYLVAGLMGLLGPTGSTLRLASALFGLAILPLTFAWVRLAFDGSTALAACALQAVSFWSLSTSRQALRSGLLPVLFTAAVYVHWRAVKSTDRPRRLGTGLLALLIGATLYTYIPARVAWIVFPAFLAYLALLRRGTFRRVWLPTLMATLVGLALAAPLFAYLWVHPDAEQRLDMLDAPLQALSKGDVSVILDRARSAMSGFLLPGYGDDFLAYNIPGRPVFDPLTGVLFLAGLGICLTRWREPACAFALLWFLIGFSPSLVTGATASSSRGIAALPVVFLFPALTAVTGARSARAHWGDRAAWAVGVGFALLIAVTGLVSAHEYFVTWGESPDVRAAYQHTLVEAARELDARGEGGVVALSTIYPNAPHDPYVFEMALRRRDLALRWFDARRALLLPSEPAARLIAPSSASLDPYFADLPGLRPRERVTLRPDDLDPFFVLYDWEPGVTLAALRERATGLPLDQALPVNFGDALQLLGYDLRTPSVPPGGTVELVTLWQVADAEAVRPLDLADVNEELVLFIHALTCPGGQCQGDVTGAVVGQEDRLDAPAWAWQTGDVIAQIHRFSLRADLPSGPVMLQVGVYRRADLFRLPVLSGSAVVDDRVLLQTVEVTEQ